MGAAINNFSAMKVAPKMVILGDMKELGAYSLDEHQSVVERLKTCDFDKIWLVGDEFARTNHTARTFHNVDEVIEALKVEGIHDYYILIKGSNGMKLSSVVPYL